MRPSEIKFARKKKGDEPRAQAKRRREIEKIDEEEIEAEIRKKDMIMAERPGPVANIKGRPRVSMGRLP